MHIENVKPHTQVNLDAFCAKLTELYTDLYKNDPDYSYSRDHISASDLARKMTLGLDNGTANKDGKAVILACKHFGIKHTYKEIREFLKREQFS